MKIARQNLMKIARQITNYKSSRIEVFPTRSGLPETRSVRIFHQMFTKESLNLPGKTKTQHQHHVNVQFVIQLIND